SHPHSLFHLSSLSPTPLSTGFRGPNTPGLVSLATTRCYLFCAPRERARRLLENVVQPPPGGPDPAKWLCLLGLQSQGLGGGRAWPARLEAVGVEAVLRTATRRPRPRTVSEPTIPARLRGNRLAAEGCGKCSWAGPARARGLCLYSSLPRSERFSGVRASSSRFISTSEHPGRSSPLDQHQGTFQRGGRGAALPQRRVSSRREKREAGKVTRVTRTAGQLWTPQWTQRDGSVVQGHLRWRCAYP
ncbi:hypothetical protein EI555_019634, partial [Monodon monoceros]